MATATVETNGKQYIEGRFDGYRILLVGAGVGFLVWALSWLLGQFIFQPLLCHGDSPGSCTNAGIVAANVASIIGAIMGMAVFIRMLLPRALIVVVAAMVALWNVGMFVAPLFWLEALVWNVALYALAYVVFAYLTRLRNLAAVAALTVLVAVIAQLLIRT